MMMQKLKIALAAGLAAAVVITTVGVDSAEARSRRDRQNAAAAAAIIGTVGAVAAIAAADSRRDRYYGDGYRYRNGYRGDGYRNRAYRNNYGGGPYVNNNPNHQGYPWSPQSLPNDAR